jgi:asparagine synthase (glutamine-hydrolysing)
MSGLAGIYNLDDRPVEYPALERMTDRIASRGPESGHWMSGPVAIGHRLLRSTPESAGERQPLSDATLGLCLSFDGRLDNRRELRKDLEASGVPLRSDTDAEIVLRAYQAWGEYCPERILGDFAFALWDGRIRQLMCARDPLGIRPFYYYADARTFVWGSEIREIFASGAVAPRPNPGMIGEYLSDHPNHLEDTLYAGVMRLPPARVLTIRDGRRHMRGYFDLDPRNEIRYRDDAAYAEHFREVFGKCVESRLRSDAPVSIFLSGGLDSSAIVGMAHTLADRQAAAGPGLALLSLETSRPEADERQYARDVGRMWNRPVRFVCDDSYVAPALVDQVRRFQDFPDAPNLPPWGLLAADAKAVGSRVVLWGHGGDEWLTGDSLHCGDMLCELRLAQAFRQVGHDRKVADRLGERASLRDVARWLLVPVVPAILKKAVRPILRRRAIPAWIRPGFAREVDLAQRLRGDSSRVRKFPTAAQTVISSSLHSGRAVLDREILDRFGASLSIEQRFPFHDRRLIEFALAIPENQRWRDDQPKYVLSEALRDVLPDSVRLRATKAEFSYMFTDTLVREHADQVFRTLRLAQAGYLDQAAVQRTYQRSRTRKGPDLSAAWTILATELWYRTMFDGKEE